MTIKRVHKVTFYSPGTMFSEYTTEDIDSWDTKKAVEMSEKIVERHGAKPYGFQFETLKTRDPVDDGEGGTMKVEAKLEKKSGTYFLGGKLETYDDVVNRNDPKEDILRSNMRNNEFWIICVTTNGYRSTMPFGENDRVVDAKGNVIEEGDNPKYIKYRKEQLAKRKSEVGY